MKDDYISSVSKKISVFSDNLDTKSLLMMLGGVGLLFFLVGSAKSGIISPSNLILIIASYVGFYLYFSRYYSSKFRKLNLKNKILKRNSILDEVCDNEELSKKNFQLCNKYKYAKSNFYIISNLLLQKFNIVN
jgi:hypothetical protein